MGADRRRCFVADRRGLWPGQPAGGDPVGQQRRERTLPVRRAPRRRAGGADLAQLRPVWRLHATRPCARYRRARPGVRPGLRCLWRRAGSCCRRRRTDCHGGWQTRHCLRGTGGLFGRRVGCRTAAPYRCRHAGQDPVHLGVDWPVEGRAEHARQSRRGGGNDPHGGRAARRPAHRRLARLAAVASHLGRQCQSQQHHSHRGLALYRRRPAHPWPFPGDTRESARAVAVQLRHCPGRLSDAARGAGT